MRGSFIPLSVRNLISQGLALMLLGGCDVSVFSEHAPTVSGVLLEVATAEWEPERHIIVIGESGTASVDVWSKDCSLMPCSVSANVELRSSNPSVLAPAQQRVHTPREVALLAYAPGTVQLTATVEGAGFAASERVDVVAAPLPIDPLAVALVSVWDGDTAVTFDPQAEYDAEGSLTSFALSAGLQAALGFKAERNGVPVFGIHFSILSAAPDVALGTIACRPTSIDDHCDVLSAGWVLGLHPGDAQITLAARNVSTAFTVHVLPVP